MFQTNNNRSTREKVMFAIRVLVAFLFVLGCFSLLIYRLWILQVERFEGFSARADSNRISLVPIPPKRGDIFDRNGEVLARSYRDYTLELIPGQVGSVDKTVEAVRQIIPISDFELKRFKNRLGQSRRFDSVILRSKITDEEAARFSLRAFEFPGVELKARWVREYPQGEVAAHLVGYVGRISQQDAKRLEEENLEGNYRGSDIIGKKGLELSYERQLHGQTGWQEIEVSATGKPVRTLKRIDPVPGDDLHLSIDLDLQRKAESLYANSDGSHENGALVAIDPRNGQVLAYVSMPSFDPNLFVDGIDVENWQRLSQDESHPLINRPISATFPIGSVYKPFVALAGLKTGARDPNTRVPDPGYYEYGGQKFRNAAGAVYGPTDMHKAIVVSSDTYFYGLGVLIGVDRLHDFVQQFGYGKKTGLDLPGEKVGVLPSTEWKRKAFKDPKQQTWYKGETISVGVGQGYNNFTIMQVAQATSTLAAGGVYTRPHIVDALHNPVTNQDQKVVSRPEYKVDISDDKINFVKDAISEVTVRGTARRAFAGAAYRSAGKTGTAQVFSLKGRRYNSASLRKNLRDHALYMGYAPAQDPQIAVGLIVENGGWGASVAAPMARKLFDYWLVTRKQLNENGEAVPEQEDDLRHTAPKIAIGDEEAIMNTAGQVPVEPFDAGANAQDMAADTDGEGSPIRKDYKNEPYHESDAEEPDDDSQNGFMRWLHGLFNSSRNQGDRP